jgi:hypothetical protein
MISNRVIFFLLVIFYLSLHSCSNNPKKENAFGNIDLEAIAADTTMQSNIEASYEYVKDHPFRGNRVFSVINGGYTGFKDAIVAERITMSDFDTLVILELDNELIEQSYVTDFNDDRSPEIMVITRPKGGKYFVNYIVSKKGQNWGTQRISLEQMMSGYDKKGANWTLYTAMLQLEYPYFNAPSDTLSSGISRIYFKLKNNRFVAEKTDSIFK